MAVRKGLGFIGTIEDGDIVDVVDESGSEEDENPIPTKKKTQTTEFNSDFRFVDKSVPDDVIGSVRKRVASTTLDQKINAARRLRKQGKTVTAEGGQGAKTVEAVEDEAPDAGADDDDVIESASDDDVSELSEDERVRDKLKTREKKGKKRDPDTVDDGDFKELDFEEVTPGVGQDLTFQDMNLSRPLLKALTTMNFNEPTPIQRATIPTALLGRDVCACAATGTGKTAAFMLPILERLLYKPVQTPITRVLVLVPTRELAIQVHQVSRQLGQFSKVDFCLAVGGLDLRMQEAFLRQGPDVLIATPGRLIDHLHNSPNFSLNHIEVLVLDEADRMLDEFFAEQMNEIIRLCCRNRQTMLFSATMSDGVKELAAVSLKKPVKIFVNSNTDVAMNLKQEFVRIRSNREGDREALAAALCSRTFRDQTIVFVQTKKQVHRLHILLGLFGLSVGELHGNLTQPQRMETLKRFKDQQIDILLATDLAARGLDIERVKTVINFTMPATIKHYIHRVGRTARAGKSGRAVTLVGEEERRVLKEVVKKARNPVKSRVVPQEIVSKFRAKIESMETEISEIARQEKEEKVMRITELQANKAQKMIEHHDEIYGRAKRTWFQSHKERMDERTRLSLGEFSKSTKTGKKNAGAVKKPSAEDRSEFEVLKATSYAARAARRAGKQKRMRACTDDADGPARKKSNRPNKKSAFDVELTDTSRKTVKNLRSKPREDRPERERKGAGRKGKKTTKGTFKSKKKYKRK